MYRWLIQGKHNLHSALLLCVTDEQLIALQRRGEREVEAKAHNSRAKVNKRQNLISIISTNPLKCALLVYHPIYNC